MNINFTLIAQAIAFAILIWFTVKYVWPPLLNAIETRQKEIAEIGADALPEGDHHHHQRYGMHHLQAAQQGNVAECRGLRIDQAIDEIFEHRRQHRLRRGEDDVTENAGGKQPGIGLDVAQQAEIDGQAGSGVRIWGLHVVDSAMKRMEAARILAWARICTRAKIRHRPSNA